MKKITTKSNLSTDEIKEFAGKILDILNNSEKPIVNVVDIIMIISTVIISVANSIAGQNSEAIGTARTIWLNIAIKVNGWFKNTMGSPIDIKIMDDKPLKS